MTARRLPIDTSAAVLNPNSQVAGLEPFDRLVSTEYNLREREATMTQNPSEASGRMPVLFMGHGSPMNAIEDNEWSRAYRAVAAELPRPKAILAVSAHWFVQGTHLTGNERPPTIHDFGGFPRALLEVQYPAPGDPDLAQRIAAELSGFGATVGSDWGLDHGTWSVLRHLHPDADCPVVQVSLDQFKTPESHVEVGRAIAGLRDEGVLILGSGNITHNLPYTMQHFFNGDTATPDWAMAFDALVAEAVERRDLGALIAAIDSDNGRMAHPTVDHYLPLLYVCAAADAADPVRFPITGFDYGSLSMRAVLFGV